MQCSSVQWVVVLCQSSMATSSRLSARPRSRSMLVEVSGPSGTASNTLRPRRLPIHIGSVDERARSSAVREAVGLAWGRRLVMSWVSMLDLRKAMRWETVWSMQSVSLSVVIIVGVAVGDAVGVEIGRPVGDAVAVGSVVAMCGSQCGRCSRCRGRLCCS